MKSTLIDLPSQRALDSKDPLMLLQGYPRITKTILVQLVGHLKTHFDWIDYFVLVFVCSFVRSLARRFGSFFRSFVHSFVHSLVR